MLGMGLFALGILVALPLVSAGLATDTSGLWIAGAAVAGTGLGLGILAMLGAMRPLNWSASAVAPWLEHQVWNRSCRVLASRKEAEMATARKIDVLTVKLDPKPGALAQVLSAFREAKVNLTASWAYQMGPTEAQAHFFAADADRAKQALTKLGKAPKTEAAFWVEDADKIGNYHGVLEKLAKAGVNIEATDAFGIGGKFATVIFVAEGDVGKASTALGV